MTDFTFISSADNEKIKLYKRLSADKKLRRKEQLFTVEGARLTADAAAEAIELHCVFFTENALKNTVKLWSFFFQSIIKNVFDDIGRAGGIAFGYADVSGNICHMQNAQVRQCSSVCRNEVRRKVHHSG